MKSVKISSAEPAKDISAMKCQLSAVIKEMSAFSARIDDLKAQNLSHGFAPSFSYEQRLQDLRTKLQLGKDPAKPVIFLVRMVIECLSRGPMSEKDIKSVVLERCRELDIKVSSRGLIAGTGMDVATVCSVLAALGVLEQIDASTVTAARMDTSEDTAAPGAAVGVPGGAQGVKVESSEVGGACPESITGPGAELYALLTERWQPRLLECYDDAQKSKAAAAAEAAAKAAAIAAAPKHTTGGDDSAAGSSVPVGAAPGSTISTAPPTPSGTALPIPLPSPSRSRTSAPPLAVPVVPSAVSATASSTAPTAPLYPVFNKSQSAAGLRTVTASAGASSGNNATATGGLPTASTTSAVPAASHSQGTHPAVTGPATAGAMCAGHLGGAELSAVSALMGLDSQATPVPSTSTAAPVGTSTAAAMVPLASSSAPSTASRLALTTGMANDPSSSGGYQPVRTQASSAPVAPNSFLSASASSSSNAHSSPGFSGSSALPTPVPPVQLVPPYTPAQPGPGLPAEVTYTSILSASGTSITIPGPGAAVESSNAKSTKTKTPKVPKQPGERKQTKRPVSKGSDLALALSGTAPGGNAAFSGLAGVGGGASAVPGGSVVGEKAKTRRGPTALRVWRIREEVLPHTAELLAPLLTPSAPSSSSSSAMGVAYAGTSALATNAAAPATPTGPGLYSNTTNSTSRNTIAPENGIATNSTNGSGNATEGNPALKLLTQPGLIQAAALADYGWQMALEMEERLLRRLAGQCNIPLKPSRYRLGTAYLSADPEGAMTQVVSSRYARGGTTGTQQVPAYFSKTAKKVSASDASNEDYLRETSSAGSNTAAEPSFALYDEGVAMTSAYLLDKVRRTKRQRGDCLYGTITLPYSGTATASVVAARSAAAASVGVYSATHVHALSTVCAKTQEYFWGAGGAGQGNSSPRGQGKGAKKPVPAAKGQSEPITVAQYARNLYMGISAGGAPVVLSSANNGGSLTAQTLRRYAQPLSLVGGNLPMLDPVKSADVFAASTSKSGSEVLRIPDLTLHTREIAWSEIANEFSVLPAPVDEPGSIALPGSTSNAMLSGKDTTQDTGPSKAGISKKPPTEKKRKYLQNHGPPPAPVSATLQDAAQRLASIEVLAPQYTEIVPACEVVRQMQASGQPAPASSDSEDTSDEAVEAKHEAVLQRMRDKWNLLQQLKAEALYGPGGVVPAGMEGKAGGGYRGGGYGGYFGGRATGGAFTSAATLPAGTGAGLDDPAGLSSLQVPIATGRFLNLSPRKRGLASAHAKQRGRPPKIAKLAHHFHAQYPSAVTTGTAPSGPDPTGTAGSQTASGQATEASNAGGSSNGSATGNNSDGAGYGSADESGQ